MIARSFSTLQRERALAQRTGRFRTGNQWVGLYSHEAPEPVYRYAFAEWWGSQLDLSRSVAWVLLNPATGDTDGKARPVLGVCRNFTRAWGYHGLVIVNLFAFRARDPKKLAALRTSTEAIGTDNDRALELITEECGLTVAAWGNHGDLWRRSTSVRRVLRDPHCLPKSGEVLSQQGEPFYPRAIRVGTGPLPLP